MNRDIPMLIEPCDYTHVKAFDGEDKVLTYNCAPCPNCGKWIVANISNKYCNHCGQALKWEETK